jgi:hypothetical protein
MLITTNQTITQWGHVFGDEMIAATFRTRSYTTWSFIVGCREGRSRASRRAGSQREAGARLRPN